MLAAGAAEAIEQILGDVVAALHRDLLDGVGHVLDRDGDEALRHRLGAAAVADLGGQRRERALDHREVERLVLAGSEDRREEVGLQLAEHEIGVGDRQRAASPVAGGPRIGAGRIRPGAEPPGLEMQDRAATGRHRMDAHHRRPHAHPRHLGVERPLVVAVIVGDVGRRAAHIEADHLVEPGEPRRLHHPDHPAGRPRQQRVLALEEIRGGQPARRHHEHQPRRLGLRHAGLHAERVGHLADIARQDRRQIGVDHRRIAATDQLDQRRHLVADRDLGEADVAAEPRHGLLVSRELPGMHEDDGDGVDAIGLGLLDRRPDAVDVERRLDRSVGAHPLVDLDDPLVELLGQQDLLGEDLRPRLVGDPQRVAKAARDEQQHPVALALQQRICRHGGAHLDVADRAGGDRRTLGHAEQLADAVDGGVAIGLGIFGKQLAGMQAALRVAADDVREGASAIDPEIPLRRHRRSVPHGQYRF